MACKKTTQVLNTLPPIPTHGWVAKETKRRKPKCVMNIHWCNLKFVSTVLFAYLTQTLVIFRQLCIMFSSEKKNQWAFNHKSLVKDLHNSLVLFLINTIFPIHIEEICLSANILWLCWKLFSCFSHAGLHCPSFFFFKNVLHNSV